MTWRHREPGHQYAWFDWFSINNDALAPEGLGMALFFELKAEILKPNQVCA